MRKRVAVSSKLSHGRPNGVFARDSGTQPGVLLRVLPLSCLPALSLLPDLSAAQLAKWAALGKTLMSTPCIHASDLPWK